MKLKELQLDGTGIRIRVPETAPIEERASATRPKTRFLAAPDVELSYDPLTQLATVKAYGATYCVHASRCSWMIPDETSAGLLELASDLEPPKRRGRPPKAQSNGAES